MKLFDRFTKKDKKKQSVVEEVIDKADIPGMMTFADYKSKSLDEDFVPGWDEIDKAFSKLYPGQKPNHFATDITKRAIFGGPEFLDGYSIYESNKGFYHVVTYGLTELYADPENYGNDYSKWGYELTFKIKAKSIEEVYFVMNMLGNLARYTFKSGNYFQINDYILGTGDAIEQGSTSKMSSLVVTEDTELSKLQTLHGEVTFLQLVAITYEDALKIHDSDEPRKVSQDILNKIALENPDFVTDMSSEKNYL